MTPEELLALTIPFEPILYRNKWEEMFWKYHKLNPHVFGVIRQEAMELRSQFGIEKCGINVLVEHFRWLSMRGVVRTDDYRINQNFNAYYARLVLDTTPELGTEFFELRKLDGDDSPSLMAGA